jgi:hypothetical protein
VIRLANRLKWHFATTNSGRQPQQPPKVLHAHQEVSGSSFPFSAPPVLCFGNSNLDIPRCGTSKGRGACCAHADGSKDARQYDSPMLDGSAVLAGSRHCSCHHLGAKFSSSPDQGGENHRRPQTVTIYSKTTLTLNLNASASTSPIASGSQMTSLSLPVTPSAASPLPLTHPSRRET